MEELHTPRPRSSPPSPKNEGGAQESNDSSSASKRRKTMDEVLRSRDDDHEVDGSPHIDSGGSSSIHPIGSGSASNPALRLSDPSSTSLSLSLPPPPPRTRDPSPPSQPEPNLTAALPKRPRPTLDQLASREMNRVGPLFLSSPAASSRLRVETLQVDLPCSLSLFLLYVIHF